MFIERKCLLIKEWVCSLDIYIYMKYDVGIFLSGFYLYILMCM